MGKVPPSPRPPRGLARFALGALARLRRQPFLVSELDDLFQRRVERDGLRLARRWYRKQVAGFLLRAPALSSRRRSTSVARSGFADDLTHAWRSLARTPGPTLAAVLILGLAVGSATAMFSVVNGALLRPLHFPRADRLVRLWARNSQQVGILANLSGRRYLAWKASVTSLDAAGAYISATPRTLTVGTEPIGVRTTQAEAGLFEVLGARPLLGRAFQASDGGESVVVVSHDLWQRALGGGPDVIGRTVDLDGAPREIVGVMPAGFAIPTDSADVWTPLVPSPVATQRGMEVLARIAPGHTLEDVRTELERVAASMAAAHPEMDKGWTVLVRPLLDMVVAPGTRRAFWTLLAVVGLLVLVGAANVATLGLARASARGREMAVRRALGADRVRLLRHLLAESAYFASGVALLGVGSARLALLAARRLGPVRIPRLDEVTVDERVLAFALALAALAAVVSCLLPALRGLGTPAAGLASPRGEGTRAGREHDGLVVGQVAVSVVLLVGAGLLLRSFHRVQERELGFQPEGVLSVPVVLREGRYPKETVQPTFERLLARLAALPGVENVSGSSGLPFLGHAGAVRVTPVDDGPITEVDAPLSPLRIVAPGYFRTLGIRVVAGSVADFDVPRAEGVAVISEAAARSFWPDEDPLGRRFHVGSPTTGPILTVVAVAQDVRYRAIEGRRVFTMIYVPQFWVGGRSLDVAVRVGPRAARSVAAALRREVAHLDPTRAPPEVKAITDVLADAMATRRFETWVLSGFAAFAMLLAVVGLFGLTSYLARRRRREIGIRMALGAGPASVARRLTIRGTVLTLAGVALGTGAALAVATHVSSLLFQTSPHDGLSFSLGAGVMGLFGTLANALPAWRAARASPADTLRGD